VKINVGWLYPKQMSTYGDRGNILTIFNRCKLRNIEVNVLEIDLKERVDPKKIDLFFFGGGQDLAQVEVSKDLQKFKKESLLEAVTLKSVFLGICGGYQLLGSFYKTPPGDELPGVGILDIFTVAGERRMIGNILIETNTNLSDRSIVGFENHSGKTFLGKKAIQFGRVVVGNGNNGEDRTEGAIQGNAYGCYLHGPLLPKNPRFADFLIEKALSRNYDLVKLKELDDSIENNAHQSSIERSRETE